jgi:ABC-type transport system involved in cytochrome bd biosynthesis fused ATPase/permease subunit
MEKVLAATNGKSLIVASHRLADTSGLDQVYQVSRPHD